MVVWSVCVLTLCLTNILVAAECSSDAVWSLQESKCMLDMRGGGGGGHL